jgi:hypothetical protein
MLNIKIQLLLNIHTLHLRKFHPRFSPPHGIYMIAHMQVSKYSSSESLESLQIINKIAALLEDEINWSNVSKTIFNYHYD